MTAPIAFSFYEVSKGICDPEEVKWMSLELISPKDF